MFASSLFDQLRLTFGHVVYRQKAHAQRAGTMARLSRWFRFLEALLMLGATVATLGAAFGKGYPYILASAILVSTTVAVLLVHLTFDFETSARSHHVSGVRLWNVREQYRALLSDATDEAVDPQTARARRDALMKELQGILESAPQIDARAYQLVRNTRLAADEGALPDEEIDSFLPKSLHKSAKSPAA
jgi:hypothetical protein